MKYLSIAIVILSAAGLTPTGASAKPVRRRTEGEVDTAKEDPAADHWSYQRPVSTIKGKECFLFDKAIKHETSSNKCDVCGLRCGLGDLMCPNSDTCVGEENIHDFCSWILNDAYGYSPTNCGICPVSCLMSCIEFVKTCCPCGSEKLIIDFSKDSNIGTTEFPMRITEPEVSDTKAFNINTDFQFQTDAPKLENGYLIGPGNQWPDRTYTGQNIYGAFISQYSKGPDPEALWSVSNANGLALGWQAGQTGGKATGLWLFSSDDFYSNLGNTCTDEITKIYIDLEVTTTTTALNERLFGIVIQDSSGWHVKTFGPTDDPTAQPKTTQTTLQASNIGNWRAFDPFRFYQDTYDIGIVPSERGGSPQSQPSFQCVKYFGILMSANKQTLSRGVARATMNVNELKVWSKGSIVSDTC